MGPIGRDVRRFIAPVRMAVGLATFVLGIALAVFPATAQSESDSGSEGAYATLSKSGWWERKPALPSVPANALGVAAENGADTKVAALGIDMFVPEDELLVGLTLRLRESSDPGATFPPITEQSQSQPQTKINVVACPITSIWTPADGGDKAAGAPVADCDMARSDGVRAATGVWTFDLSPLAELWMSDTIEQNGLLLIERVGPPLSFQVSYQDISTGTAMLDLQTEPVLEDDAEDTTDEEVFTETETTDTGGGDSLFSEIGADVTGTTDTPFGITDTPPTTAPAPETADSGDEVPISNRTPTKGELPLGTLALVPIVLGLALMSGVVLGPAGDPATGQRREGGLSRALAKHAGEPAANR